MLKVAASAIGKRICKLSWHCILFSITSIFAVSGVGVVWAENYAVVIGYTSARDLGGSPPYPQGFTKLPDAHHVQEGLETLGWDPDNIRVRDNEFNQDGTPKQDGDGPTLANIRDDLEWLLEMNGTADVVLFHYAGHTNTEENEEEEDRCDEGMVLTDGTLWDDEFTETIKKFCNKSRAVIIQIDACWSAGMVDDFEELIKDCPNMHFGFSSAEDQTSESSTTIFRGHAYTDYKWVKGFEYELGKDWEPKDTVVADANEDGKITIEELEEYAAKRVVEETKGEQVPQFFDGSPEEVPLSAHVTGHEAVVEPYGKCVIMWGRLKAR